ncbi:universal stress protein [Herbiconiux liangxiaofengii]|uniref:universal stress protein n=1 Tax=Herbiconiux liangxiaofengii TaxID=3342795 RepID=UPI0035B765EA
MSSQPSETPAPAHDGPAASGIVVGHDGSDSADDALVTALDLAVALSASVVIVRSWSIDTAPRGAIFHDGYAASFVEVTERVRQELMTDTEAVVGRYPGCEVEYRAVLGQPAEVLITASAGARMLVVGSRGLGGFAGLVLGSVSEQCVRHARCPVLVVPHAEPDTAESV